MPLTIRSTLWGAISRARRRSFELRPVLLGGQFASRSPPELDPSTFRPSCGPVFLQNPPPKLIRIVRYIILEGKTILTSSNEAAGKVLHGVGYRPAAGVWLWIHDPAYPFLGTSARKVVDADAEFAFDYIALVIQLSCVMASSRSAIRSADRNQTLSRSLRELPQDITSGPHLLYRFHAV